MGRNVIYVGFLWNHGSDEKRTVPKSLCSRCHINSYLCVGFCSLPILYVHHSWSGICGWMWMGPLAYAYARLCVCVWWDLLFPLTNTILHSTIVFIYGIFFELSSYFGMLSNITKLGSIDTNVFIGKFSHSLSCLFAICCFLFFLPRCSYPFSNGGWVSMCTIYISK